MNPKIGLALAMWLTTLLIAGCGGNFGEPDHLPEMDQAATTLILSTPAADSPASGICAEFDGEKVTITIHPDIPDPRCTIIRPEQILEVVNQRGEDITVRIGHHQAEAVHGESVVFDQPLGKYLAPGVHLIEVLPCCGAELWLKGD